MFMMYELLTTFGISVMLSFTLSMIVLVAIAAKRGMLRVGAGSKNSRIPTSSLLLPPTAAPIVTTAAPKTVELTPLSPEFV